MAQYQYRPLQSPRRIRLLRLQRRGLHVAGATDHEIVAELQHFSLDSPSRPIYEPISYVWAGPEVQSPDEALRSQGTRRDRFLPTVTGHVLSITPSLQETLSDLMKVSETGYLWIDQLCIHQEDPLERGRQVAIMHEIYAGGFRTLVWLGRDNVHAQFIRTILRHVGYCPEGYRKPSRGADWWDTIKSPPPVETLAKLEPLPTRGTGVTYFKFGEALTYMVQRAWVSNLRTHGRLLPNSPNRSSLVSGSFKSPSVPRVWPS